MKLDCQSPMLIALTTTALFLSTDTHLRETGIIFVLQTEKTETETESFV